MTEDEDEIAELRAMAALLDYLKRSHPHGLRLTPQNLIVAAELVRFDQAEAYECDGQLWIRRVGTDLKKATSY
jgi:hypothetical protein